jgi:hypothetical protein
MLNHLNILNNNSQINKIIREKKNPKIFLKMLKKNLIMSFLILTTIKIISIFNTKIKIILKALPTNFKV